MTVGAEWAAGVGPRPSGGAVVASTPRPPTTRSAARGARPIITAAGGPILLAMLLLLLPSVRAFELSCASSRVPSPTSLDFCSPVVTWRAAAVYSHINYTDFRAGARFTDLDQDRIAKRQYEDLVFGHGEVSTPCAKALQRFVCASVFPECPHEGFGVPFKAVCRSTCREAEAACGLPLSCDFLQAQDCTVGVKEGFFMLKDDQGPYEPLPYLYGALLAVWAALSLVWLYNICRPHATSSGLRHRPASRLCRILTCVPLAKVAMMFLSLAFWSTCVAWGYCSFWMGVSLINCQLLYETFSLVGFVLIAKGWCITRPGFHPSEWRTVIILVCTFYLASSSLLLVRRVVLSSAVFWLCTGLLYGSAYGYVLFNVRDRIHSIRRQMRRALRAEGGRMTSATSPDARFRYDLMLLKHWMYQTLSVLLTVFCVTELVFCLLPLLHHVDLAFLPAGLRSFLDAIADLDARLWLTLIVHEVVEIAILFMVGFLFRPRLLTTFFYVELWDEGARRAAGEDEKRRRPPPLYLIPVPAAQYHHPLAPPPAAGAGPDDAVPDSSGGGDGHSSTTPKSSCGHGHLIIPRKQLSPSDLQFTLSSSGGDRRRRRSSQGRRWPRRQQGESESEEEELLRGSPASAAGRVEREPLADLTEQQEQPPSRGQPAGAEEATDRLLAPVHGASARERDEAEQLAKPVLQYHASRFLVVQLPNGLYAVAMAEEGSEEEEEGDGRNQDKEAMFLLDPDT